MLRNDPEERRYHRQLVSSLSARDQHSQPRYHHHKHQGLGHLTRSVSRVTAALVNVSSVFQLFSFLVDLLV